MVQREENQERNRAEPAPFDVYLRRVLKDRFGRVAKEPIPANLLALLDENATQH